MLISLIIRITIEVNMMMNNPAHAGELVSEWLDGLKEEGQAITITELAERIQVTRPLLSRIINGKAPVTADVALRLHDALGISADLLMRVQSKYSLWMESQKQRPQIQPFLLIVSFNSYLRKNYILYSYNILLSKVQLL